ncbi:aldo/keto reductase [Burkholderia ubonensis]|uniref:aldo/keto reductase n=1 Tax=Burkholderia ubonensis TaxID=101571 RepID=UPI00075EED0D|nr:aldo/keto reductase [Burkholderia ubonensis]
MHYRRFGRLGYAVSELALGTWGYDDRMWKDADDTEVAAAFALALDRGVNMIDTATAYGRAEEWIGRLLQREGRSRDVFVATKVMPLIPIDLPSPQIRVEEVFPGDHLRRSTEASLRALKIERLGLQQLHTWSPMWLGEGDWLESFEALRREGKIAGYGVSLFDHDPDSALPLVETGLIDSVQVMYNLFDQGASRALFAACERHGVAVIVRSPLYAGALGGGMSAAAPFHPDDWRATYFYPEHLAETRGRTKAILTDIGDAPEALPQLALRFCLSDPAVSTVAIGMRRRWHVYANLHAAANGPLEPTTLAYLSRHAWLC